MPAKKNAKVPKGTRDFDPQEMAIRERAFSIVTSVFKRHGAVAIDTPVFELKDILVDQYGEDSKLIYDIADQGGEILSLRYDLTVPFARYLASHRITNMKRYHISRVYRRDQPSIERGRFREFYQCDLDIAGEYPSMVPDSEILKVLIELLQELSSVSEFHRRRLGNYVVKISNRKILDGVFKVCGVEEKDLRPISSSIDKLDKMAWEEVKKEMVDAKGLDEGVADAIGELVRKKGYPKELLAELKTNSKLVESCGTGFEEMERLFQYLESMNILESFSFDLSLARGLDYYTGVIFEAVLMSDETSVGSIAAGGRYDHLVGKFSRREVPCVGCSLGIERVLTIMREAELEMVAEKGGKIRVPEIDVYVGSPSSGERLLNERMRICSSLWEASIRCELNYSLNPKMNRQLEYVGKQQIPLLVIVGEDELEKGVVQLKDLAKKKNHEVKFEELVASIKTILEPIEA
mmetsp:Transcript_5827/g.24523  ORF Transcript_5827/g.24523 Transcript_5827/m.24523 type:complete len:464 (-) Transcript_5827:1083-2474(-)|eukprot:CAMPEP_0113956922 /NCGR_PEP_ID=MMETSP0011_2-20120614/2386_1 /TAXON_ID=101924 /ORGANISM="Rhodosorus marinus" /LENGTH=463 /DNA_ID=CAMNT_0000967233 /DNA_START=706 /DNA_END=2097 /DNA_ORIENTATION=- /assembly_acc=CAM_ASM_000156